MPPLSQRKVRRECAGRAEAAGRGPRDRAGHGSWWPPTRRLSPSLAVALIDPRGDDVELRNVPDPSGLDDLVVRADAIELQSIARQGRPGGLECQDLAVAGEFPSLGLAHRRVSSIELAAHGHPPESTLQGQARATSFALSGGIPEYSARWSSSPEISRVASSFSEGFARATFQVSGPLTAGNSAGEVGADARIGWGSSGSLRGDCADPLTSSRSHRVPGYPRSGLGGCGLLGSWLGRRSPEEESRASTRSIELRVFRPDA